MNFRTLFFLVLLFLFAVAPRPGADAQDEIFARLPPAVSVVEANRFETARSSSKSGTIEPVAISGQPFTKAERITTTDKPANPYSFQLTLPSTADVKKGGALLAVFYARAIPPLPPDDEARTEFVFELSGAPYTKSASHPVTFGVEWRKFYVPFEAKADLSAGKANVSFRAGYDPQTIEIGGFQLLQYPPEIARKDLPATPISYVGRDANAAWRKAADERIEKLRKADLAITVSDAYGQPIPGAKVAVRMKRHAFGFGSAVDAQMLFSKGADGDRYREAITRNFNKVVIENHLKWHVWEKDRESGPAAVKWLRDHGLEVRGHCLVWPGKRNLPQSAVDLFDRPEALRKTVLDHVTDEATALKGQLVEWDVLNEPFSNTDLQRILGEEILADAFKAAREADPQPTLFINDYSILETCGKDSAHQDHYEKTIRSLLEQGAPVQGIGIQGHFGEDLTPVPRLLEIMDRFGKFGLPIQITEFDINTYDEALQADYTHDFMTAIFSHPSSNGILSWGFWENRHWIGNAAMFRADWSLRPAGEAWRKLVFETWWTNAQGKSDKHGGFAVRGFLGDYEIAVTAGRKSATVPARLEMGGAKVAVTLR